MCAETLQEKRQFVCIPGEPGVGNTTLVACPSAASFAELRLREFGRGQCLENGGEMEPYIAVLEALGRLCREPDGDEVASQGAPHGSHKCPGSRAIRVLRNSLKGTWASLATACCANSPNSSKSWLPLDRSSSASTTCIGVPFHPLAARIARPPR